MSRLIEFHNHKGELLRGILDETSDTDHAVVFVHGFERTTIESKFKRIVDAMRGNATLFRFDFSGCGLSDGSFEDLTVEKLSYELHSAVTALKQECPHSKRISFVGFSLGCCVIVHYLSIQELAVDKLVFFAPGLNQRNLLRYFFTRRQYRDTMITWDNFMDFFDEASFNQDVALPKRMMKEHYLSSDYFSENSEKDYQQDFLSLTVDKKNVCILQGTDDDKVPPASNEVLYRQYPPLLVQGGDHELQRPDMVEQYFSLVVGFLQSQSVSIPLKR